LGGDGIPTPPYDGLTSRRRLGRPWPVGRAGVILALQADTVTVPYCGARVTICLYITWHPSSTSVSCHSVRIEARGSTRVLLCLRSQLCAHLQSIESRDSLASFASVTGSVVQVPQSEQSASCSIPYYTTVYKGRTSVCFQVDKELHR
jgi:hypothetical protein